LSAPDVARTITPEFRSLTPTFGNQFTGGGSTAPPAFGGFPRNPGGFQNVGGGFTGQPVTLESIARTGGGFKGGGFPAPPAQFGGFGGGFQCFGGGSGIAGSGCSGMTFG